MPQCLHDSPLAMLAWQVRTHTSQTIRCQEYETDCLALNRLLRLSPKQWCSRKDSIARCFYQYGHRYGPPSQVQEFLLSDTLEVKIAVAALASSLHGSQAVGSQHALVWRAKFADLTRYADDIRGSVASSGLDTVRKVELLALLPTTEKKRASLKGIPGLPLHTRARLGDREAEAALIRAYDQSPGFTRKAQLVRELVAAGTPAALERLVCGFNEPVYGGKLDDMDKSPCLESIRWCIIAGMARHHPENALLTDTLGALLNYYRNSTDVGAVRIRGYLQNTQAFLERTYGVLAKDPEPYPVLRRACVRQ